jgi:hypothetical protein
MLIIYFSVFSKIRYCPHFEYIAAPGGERDTRVGGTSVKTLKSSESLRYENNLLQIFFFPSSPASITS